MHSLDLKTTSGYINLRTNNDNDANSYLKLNANDSINQEDIGNLNSINDALEINNFNLFNLNNNFFKIILDFKVIKMDVLTDFLDNFGFDKTVLSCDNGEG